mmetsp:Transcript_122888/g.342455  ORF Transcript_122888/g.342455 Transcript_122888/m.342455 type:complete len:236 (+) Transcript_122888:108-815(+)
MQHQATSSPSRWHRRCPGVAPCIDPPSSPCMRRCMVILQPCAPDSLLLHGPTQGRGAWVVRKVSHVDHLTARAPRSLEPRLCVLVGHATRWLGAGQLRGPQEDVGMRFTPPGPDVCGADDALRREKIAQPCLADVPLHSLPQAARGCHERHACGRVLTGPGHHRLDGHGWAELAHAALVDGPVLHQKPLHEIAFNLAILLPLIDVSQDIWHGPTAVTIECILADGQTMQTGPLRP